jgi:hypothetical protein
MTLRRRRPGRPGQGEGAVLLRAAERVTQGQGAPVTRVVLRGLAETPAREETLAQEETPGQEETPAQEETPGRAAALATAAPGGPRVVPAGTA